MRKRGDGALTQPKAERGAILARPAGGANTDYHSSRRWPRRSISVPQIAQVQPPHKAWRTEAGRRNLGTGVPHSGQPPCALTSSCTFTDHNRAANAPIAAEIPTISIFPRRAGPGPPNLMRPHDCRPYRLDEVSATVCGCRVLILEVCVAPRLFESLCVRLDLDLCARPHRSSFHVRDCRCLFKISIDIESPFEAL